MNLDNLAASLVAAHNRCTAAVRPIDKRLAAAELSGYCKAIDALRLAPTPTAVELTILDAIRAEGNRPTMNLSSRSGTSNAIAWDSRVAERIKTDLGWQS